MIPYVGLNFAVYGTLKDMAAKAQGLESARELSVPMGLVCGGIAGAIGQTVAYPFDVCRRKLQAASRLFAHTTRFRDQLEALTAEENTLLFHRR